MLGSSFGGDEDMSENLDEVERGDSGNSGKCNILK